MWSRVLSFVFALTAFFLFMRFPSLDTMILGCAVLLLPASWLEEIWAKIKGPPPLDAPQLCPQCGYDVRATPVRCPECGQLLEQPDAASSGFSKGAVYQSLTLRR